MKTAVVMPMNRKGSYGDLMLQCPFLFGLKQLGAERIVIIYPHEFANILVEMGLVEKVHIVSDKNSAAIKEIFKAEQPTWALTLRGTSVRSTLLVGTSKCKLTGGWSSFLNNIFLKVTAKQTRDIYWPFILNRILEKLGGSTDIKKFSQFLVSQNTEKDHLTKSKRFVFMPCGSFDAKQWGIKNYLELGKSLKDKHPDAKLITILGPREEPMKNEFEAHGWVAIVKPSPLYLMALCVGALGIVSNDSGPSHIAQMSFAPIVVIYPQVEKKGWYSTENIIGAYWWQRQQSYAICTKTPRPISDIPPQFVLSKLNKAMDPNLNENYGVFYWE